MPSPRHDTINRLFRDRPELAVEVLRELMGVQVPVAGPVRLESNDFNDRPSKDFQPDTVITVGPPRRRRTASSSRSSRTRPRPSVGSCLVTPPRCGCCCAAR